MKINLLKILPLIMLMIVLFPVKSFAEMPKIEAGEQYLDPLKGYFVLKDNVRVEINNHGHSFIITANEAKVNVVTQKCWAEGKVNLKNGKETFSCDKAYLQWKTRTAEVVGNLKFNSEDNLSVTADKAIFNWKTKIVDFYDDVKVKVEKTVQLEEGLKIKKKKYAHVQYNIKENKILMIEEKADDPDIEIPDPDKDAKSDEQNTDDEED